MRYTDLRDFIRLLEQQNELKRIPQAISPILEMTEISDRVLKQGGPALLFETPQSGATHYDFPVLTNLFGTVKRVALGMGAHDATKLREIGQFLAHLKEPSPPKGWRDLLHSLPLLKKIFAMAPKITQKALCQQMVWEGAAVDLERLPIQQCWPKDVGKLITWGLTVTQGPHKKRQNLGIYRQQVIDRNRVIMRWLAHRGGALDFSAFQKVYPHTPYPVAVVIGCDPATILSAVTPIPDALSEYQFAGLLRGSRTVLSRCLGSTLHIPATAECVLEGHIYPDDVAIEGPFGDHTGYYNEQERFPVLTIERITHRADAIYHSTYTGKPPDEPSVLGLALNDVFTPILQKQFSEIIDFYLPPEGCSYRLAIVSINKRYPGHARRIMMGCWSFLRQFMYTKFIIVVDDDIDIRNWQEVIWAITTRVDPVRDTVLMDHTPIDYLDFASPVSGLGGKMGLDATNKRLGETQREWGRPISMSPEIKRRVDQMWQTLGL